MIDANNPSALGSLVVEHDLTYSFLTPSLDSIAVLQAVQQKLRTSALETVILLTLSCQLALLGLLW